MTESHKGFVEASGVQKHPAGSHCPYTVVCIGGFPAANNDAYCEVWGPDDRKDGPFGSHEAAEEWATWLKKLGDAADLVSGVRK